MNQTNVERAGFRAVDITVVQRTVREMLRQGVRDIMLQMPFYAIMSEKDVSFIPPAADSIAHTLPLASFSPRIKTLLAIDGDNMLAARDCLRTLCITRITEAEARIHHVVQSDSVASEDRPAVLAEALREIISWRNFEEQLRYSCVGIFDTGE
jgi:hypothetical protein